MAHTKDLQLLLKGRDAWNQERPEVPHLEGADLQGLDLSGYSLDGAQLSEANLSGANLDQAGLRGTFLSGANLSNARIRGANLYYARCIDSNLCGADLRHSKMVGITLDAARLRYANLSNADLSGAHVRQADLTGARLVGALMGGASIFGSNLSGADLTGAVLAATCIVQTNIEGSVFDGAMVYGIAAWDLHGRAASSDSLSISANDSVTVSDLRLAQFVYLMLENSEIRNVIDTLTSKVVLLLGRFTGGHKQVLEMMRGEFLKRDLVPVIFDFEKPRDRSTTETVTLLARLARFIVVDISEPRSVPQELTSIIREVEIPTLPILQAGQEEWSMLEDLRMYPWLLPTRRYAEASLSQIEIDGFVGILEEKRRAIQARKSAS
jgi:hypothetical protein